MDKRERLGSTAVGNGVALPSLMAAQASKPRSHFSLASAMESIFISIDGEPVDILVLLPNRKRADSENGNALACVARALRDTEKLRKIRSAPDREALFRAIGDACLMLCPLVAQSGS